MGFYHFVYTVTVTHRQGDQTFIGESSTLDLNFTSPNVMSRPVPEIRGGVVHTHARVCVWGSPTVVSKDSNLQDGVTGNRKVFILESRSTRHQSRGKHLTGAQRGVRVVSRTKTRDGSGGVVGTLVWPSTGVSVVDGWSTHRGDPFSRDTVPGPPESSGRRVPRRPVSRVVGK